MILSGFSLNQFLTFVSQLEVLVKQMGRLLAGKIISNLSKVLVTGIVRLVKIFLRDDVEEGEHEDENEMEENHTNVHLRAKKQAKSCLRKSLGMINDLYKKFCDDEEFVLEFSNIVHEEVIRDQLPVLNIKYS